MNERNEQIKAVMADEAFVKSCIDAENEEAVQKLFAEKGVEMSLTEIELMKEMVTDLANGNITEEQLEMLANNGELTEDDLANAAGGNWHEIFFKYKSIANRVMEYAEAMEYKQSNLYVSTSLTGAGWGAVIGGLVVAGGAAYGICKACGVDVEGGIKSAYNWVADKVTSRW